MSQPTDDAFKLSNFLQNFLDKQSSVFRMPLELDVQNNNSKNFKKFNITSLLNIT